MTADPPPPDATTLLCEARAQERAGRMAEAVACYAAAIDAADRGRAPAILAEALRRLGVVHHRQNEPALARTLCERSFETATELGDAVLAAEALNALAGFDFESGAMEAAREKFHRALALGATSAEVRARAEQNLGILANIQGDLGAALVHYHQSMLAFESAGDERGCAIAFHNLGMASADRELWDEADGHFRRSHEIATAVGDVHLTALGLLNRSEVHVARRRFDEARRDVEASLAIFDRLGSRLDKADAYKVLGVVYRETGRFMLAESRFRAAIEQAVSTGSVLSEAEALRELARLYQLTGRNQEALSRLTDAHRLFGRLDARVDLVDVASKVHRLEETYFTVVREWGQSIESADSYTFGHCERVADYAVSVGQALGLDEIERTTLRVGAYLHDVGKMRVPHEILNKPAALTPEEFGVIQMHPVWGIELLDTVEFPWDIKPIIRWHHEKYDGTGYPDRLRGDEIPIGAQSICIVDVYDALTTTRSYRGALPHMEAVGRMRESRHWWRDDVYEAFMSSVGHADRAA